MTDKLAGTWTLVSFVMVDEDTGAREALYGTHPNGRLILDADGRMMAIVTAEDRKAPHDDGERADAFKSMLAYSGVYEVDGDHFTTAVEVAWNEAWVGTKQRRAFRLQGDKLTIVSVPQPAVNFGNRMMHGELVWSRAKLRAGAKAHFNRAATFVAALRSACTISKRSS